MKAEWQPFGKSSGMWDGNQDRFFTHLNRLVATLGSKSGLKKVNRKAIIDVNVPKACETIITPQAPMALRLQSNLLWVH